MYRAKQATHETWHDLRKRNKRTRRIDTVVHDAVPTFTRGHAKKHKQTVAKVLEVRMLIDEVAMFNAPEKLLANNGIHKEQHQ